MDLQRVAGIRSLATALDGATVAVVDDVPLDVDGIRANATDTTLASLRLDTAVTAASHLRDGGQALHLVGAIFGDGRRSGASSRGNGDDAQVAVGVLVQIAASLLDASASLLSGANPYAGAALLRQVVEVEALLWAFANGKRQAEEWLNSTHQERQAFFTPVKLREISDGRFLAADYRHHCEQGGHPVPKGIPLLGSADASVTQMLLVDLLLHSWRATDSVIEWAAKHPAYEHIETRLMFAQRAFAEWGASDPLYSWALTAPPAPPP